MVQNARSARSIDVSLCTRADCADTDIKTEIIITFGVEKTEYQTPKKAIVSHAYDIRFGVSPFESLIYMKRQYFTLKKKSLSSGSIMWVTFTMNCSLEAMNFDFKPICCYSSPNR